MKSLKQILEEAGQSVVVDGKDDAELSVASVAPQGADGEAPSFEHLEPKLEPVMLEPLQRRGIVVHGCLWGRAELVVTTPPGTFKITAVTGAASYEHLGGSEWRLRAANGSALLLSAANGEETLLSVDAGRLFAETGLREPLPPLRKPGGPGTAPSEIPLNDEWLRTVVGAKMNSTDLYEQAQAWGTVHRLAMPTGAQARQAVTAILSGQAPQLANPAVDWIRSRSPAELEAIEQRGMASADFIARELTSLVEYAADLPGWHERVKLVFHQRDELEGIASLLHAVRHATVLETALEAVDAEASELMERLPPVRGLRGDTWLRRAAISSPEAWWTVLVA